MTSDSKRDASICAALIGITVVAYWSVRLLSFTLWDDPLYVMTNANVRTGLSWTNVWWALTTPHAGNWHPVTWISHMADCQLFGQSPGGHHVVSLIVHVANVVALFWVLKVATAMVWRSAFVAALFAIHPLNVESVAWVSERKNLLSTLFFILAIWAYVWYARGPNWKRYLIVAALFILGLMSKPMLVTLPFVLLLLDYWPLERWRPGSDAQRVGQESGEAASTAAAAKISGEGTSVSLRYLILEKTPLIVLSAAAGVVTVYTQRGFGTLSSMVQFTAKDRVFNPAASYVRYLGQAAWPAGLSAFYPYHRAALRNWQSILILLALISVTALAIWWARRFKFFAVGWLWYVGTLVPVIGVVQVGGQAHADRYVYLPLIGIFVVVIWFAAEATRGWSAARRVLIASVVCWMVVLTAVTRRQVLYWQDTVTLFEHAEQVTGPNWMASSLMGDFYIMQGDFDQAIRQFHRFDQAMREYWKSPEDDPMDERVQHDRGMAAMNAGQFGMGLMHFKMAVEANPYSYDAYNNLGAALVDAGEGDEAIPCFKKVLQLKPDFPPAYANLGNLFEQLGRYDEAILWYGKALDLVSTGKVASNDQISALAAKLNVRIGDLQVKIGHPQDARGHYVEALRLAPNSEDARQALSSLSSSGR